MISDESGIAEVPAVLEAGSSESIAPPGVSDHSLTQQADVSESNAPPGVGGDSLAMPGVESEVAPETNTSAPSVVEQTSNVVIQRAHVIEETRTVAEPASRAEQHSTRSSGEAAHPGIELSQAEVISPVVEADTPTEEEEPAPPGLEPELVNKLFMKLCVILFVGFVWNKNEIK